MGTLMSEAVVLQQGGKTSRYRSSRRRCLSRGSTKCRSGYNKSEKWWRSGLTGPAAAYLPARSRARLSRHRSAVLSVCGSRWT